MKAKTLQIVWHTKDPVYSVDFHPDGYLATGGGDKDIKVWELICAADNSIQVRYVASLAGHDQGVNCVRFSKTGRSLASAGDKGEICIWRPMSGSAVPATPAMASTVAAAATPTTKQQPPTQGSHAEATKAGTAAAAAQHSGSPSSNSEAPPATPAVTPAANRLTAKRTNTFGAPATDDGTAAGPAVCWAGAVQRRMLRGHQDDVTDLAWSHDETVLLSSSVENEVMMFDVDKRCILARLHGHRHYVQGVAWDPLGSWLASASADRTVRVYGLKPPPTGSKAKASSKSCMQLAKDYVHHCTLAKRALPQPAAAAATAAGTQACTQGQQQQLSDKPLQAFLFQDESLKVFFRRLAWSPDGSLLAIPAGTYSEAGQPAHNSTFMYARGQWGAPLVSLPCPGKASTVVRFCPLMFSLRGINSPALPATADTADAVGSGSAAGAAGHLGLPYRLVLAVATLDSVLLYDTQTMEPFALVGPLHYAPITDLSWTHDGKCLAISSHDGYCSFVTFEPGEIGDVIDRESLPAGLPMCLDKVAAMAAAAASHNSAGRATALPPISVVAQPVAATAIAGKGPQSAVKQQQQQPGVKRIQPQQVIAMATDSPAPGTVTAASTAATAAFGAAPDRPASASLRRISPIAVAATAGNNVASAALTGAHKMTPVHVHASAEPAADKCKSSCAVVDLTAADEGPAAASAQQQAATATGAAGSNPAPRRLTPQPVPPPATASAAQQQSSQSNHLPAAAATSAAPGGGAPAGGRIGLAAVQAALAAAKQKKAAAKRVGSDDTDTAIGKETNPKRAKLE